MYCRVLPLYVYVVNRSFELLCENKESINKFNALFPLFTTTQFDCVCAIHVPVQFWVCARINIYSGTPLFWQGFIQRVGSIKISHP